MLKYLKSSISKSRLLRLWAHSTISVNPNRYRYRDQNKNRNILMAILRTISGFILLVMVSIPIAILIQMPTFTHCGIRLSHTKPTLFKARQSDLDIVIKDYARHPNFICCFTYL